MLATIITHIGRGNNPSAEIFVLVSSPLRTTEKTGFVFAFCERRRNLFAKRRGFSLTERFTYPFTKGETSTFSLHKRKSCKKKCASVPLERCRLWREKPANSARTPSHTRNCPLGARMLPFFFQIKKKVHLPLRRRKWRDSIFGEYTKKNLRNSVFLRRRRSKWLPHPRLR